MLPLWGLTPSGTDNLQVDGSGFSFQWESWPLMGFLPFQKVKVSRRPVFSTPGSLADLTHSFQRYLYPDIP